MGDRPRLATALDARSRFGTNAAVATQDLAITPHPRAFVERQDSPVGSSQIVTGLPVAASLRMNAGGSTRAPRAAPPQFVQVIDNPFDKLNVAGVQYAAELRYHTW